MSDKPHIHLSGFISSQNCRYWTKKNSLKMCKRPLHCTEVVVPCAVYCVVDKREKTPQH